MPMVRMYKNTNSYSNMQTSSNVFPKFGMSELMLPGNWLHILGPNVSRFLSPYLITLWCLTRMSFVLTLQGCREKGSGGGAPAPSPLPGAKKFFHLISENITVLIVKNIWDLSLFIEQDISDKKYSKLSYHSYQQRVCKIMFLIRTFVKTNVT